MMHIRFTHNRLTVCGHADYAPYGEDIVCAAVSALVIALAAYLRREKLVTEVILRPGYATVAASAATPAFAVVRSGLEQIAAQYPQCVEMQQQKERSTE